MIEEAILAAFDVWENIVISCENLYEDLPKRLNQIENVVGISTMHISCYFSVVLVLFMVFFCRTKKRNSWREDDVKPFNVFDLAKTAYKPGHAALVMKLIRDYGYDVNYMMPSNGLSLFLCACLSGDKGLVSYMLSKGADVYITTKDGDSPLYLATYGIVNSCNPDMSLITELVQAGCDINIQNNRGYTPLHRAASKGNVKVIRNLLKMGADPYICSKSGIYPIDSALNSGHHEAVNLLKINLDNPHVWELVDPHTPPRITLGLQSPIRKHLLESTRPCNTSKVLA